MSVENYDRITENTASSKDQCVQLIFIDGVPSGYCHKVSNARILIEDIADKLERDLQTDGKRVFRETSDDGTEIKISRQSIGYIVDGGVALKHTLSFRSVPKYYKFKTETPPVPSQHSQQSATPASYDDVDEAKLSKQH